MNLLPTSQSFFLALATAAAFTLNSCDDELLKQKTVDLDPATKEKCLAVLRAGLHGEDFWPSIHAAEGLTLGGYGEEVIPVLEPKLQAVTDDQMLCGVSRELVRAGETDKAQVMLNILEKPDQYGHTHAAESLFKVDQVGDKTGLRRAFEKGETIKLRLMAAAALARDGDQEMMAFIRENLQQSENEEGFQIAAWILGRIGGKQDIPHMRARIPDTDDPLIKAYMNHSMAALGDKEALVELAKNLQSEDPAIRTYAATFAGDARAGFLKDQLIKMLDDPHPDASYRAAQTLLFLSR